MLQLVYMSTATGPVHDADVVALCRQAARNNALGEITGILLIQGGHFLQALEGPRAIVEDTFLRIVGDARHTDLTVLFRHITPIRQFGEWAMARPADPGELRAFVGQVQAVMGDIPARARHLFEHRFACPSR